jgi:holo-[acyl-carrier protein] synthase
MLLYTGIDIIEVERVAQAAQRWGTRFLERVFSPGEVADCGLNSGGVPRWPSLAARWAAKEAAAKALGVGLRGIGGGGGGTLALREIEVRRDLAGRPVLLLHGAAAARVQALCLSELALSLSHTRSYAVASVVGIAPTRD